MKRSTDRILTTHAGRLLASNSMGQMVGGGAQRSRGELIPQIKTAMREVVEKQVQAGIDVISDGEVGKIGGITYFGPRMSGIERKKPEGEPSMMSQRTNERIEFAEFYETMGTFRNMAPERLCATGPLKFTGQADVRSDTELFKEALQGVKTEEQFMCALAPGWIEHGLWNEYYKSDEEFLFGIADAMHDEYKAIVDSGFILQLDDPGLPDTYDMIVPAPSIEDYRKFAEIRVEAQNHALRGIPEDRVRYHICWGSWHGPHTHDLPLKHVVDLMLRINAQAYSVEAANPRHEHEWKVWRDVKLPEGKILIPGVVSHASNVVEHPELVADRIIQYAELVGKENVIAGTDCGMGGRVHMQIGWAKLKALSEGAELASKQLWR
ncbi:MAG: cobalamin-independent methionine synthase II family protein [Chloroflexi bacterium]|nr:cobalamin-independent methionine synthase II family protein [Chloroflexota bacterium]